MEMDTDHAPLFLDDSYRYFEAPSIESCPDPTLLEQIELVVLYDNAPAFVELINNLPSHLLDEELIYSNTIWSTMFFYDSGKCAAAVLDGLTKINELPSAKSQVDNVPLHHAASRATPKIAASLLQRGFSADVRGDINLFFDKRLKNVLPLHIILTRLRLKFSAEGAPMLVKLCELPIRRNLETLRVIALNTREIKREFFNYLKEGKTLEVAALLLVAKSHILSPSNGEGEFRSISEMDSFVLSTIIQLNRGSRVNRLTHISRFKTPVEVAKCKKLVDLKETQGLLQIFDKTGDKLAALLRVDFTSTCFANCSTLLAASLIEDAGFDVKYFYRSPSRTRSEAESYYLKGAIDACEKTIRTSDMLPIWVKEAALTGLGVKSGNITCLTYPLLAETLPYVNSVSVSPLTPGSASPMLENMTLLHRLLKKTAPFLGVIKEVFGLLHR